MNTAIHVGVALLLLVAAPLTAAPMATPSTRGSTVSPSAAPASAPSKADDSKTNPLLKQAEAALAEKDYAGAMRWYRQAADGGSAAGMFGIGQLYFQGHGVERDRQQALEWYRKAAEAGSGPACDTMGVLYTSFPKVVKRDRNEALRWFRKGAELGDVDAMTQLAGELNGGRFSKATAEEADRWNRKAAELGNAFAMVAVGDSPRTTPDERLRWYHKAADAGSREAQDRLNEIAARAANPPAAAHPVEGPAVQPPAGYDSKDEAVTAFLSSAAEKYGFISVRLGADGISPYRDQVFNSYPFRYAVTFKQRVSTGDHQSGIRTVRAILDGYVGRNSDGRWVISGDTRSQLKFQSQTGWREASVVDEDK